MTDNSAGIYRIILPISDLNQAVDFYEQLFEQKGRAVGGGRHYFDCGPVILAILDNKKSPISDYIYFSVGNLEEFYTRAKKLNCLSTDQVHGAAAGEILTRPWGERCFYAFDPSGNGLCFVDEKTLFTGHR